MVTVALYIQPIISLGIFCFKTLSGVLSRKATLKFDPKVDVEGEAEAVFLLRVSYECDPLPPYSDFSFKG